MCLGRLRVSAPRHGYVGSSMARNGPAAGEGGVTVRPPRTNSAAAMSGLREGDVIVAVDSQAILGCYAEQGSGYLIRVEQLSESEGR